MELISLFLLSFGVGFSGAMMPGPLLVVSIAETPRNGWATGAILSFGHAIAEIVVVAVLSFGMVAITNNSMATSIIGIVGGTALLWMGASMAYNTLRGRISYEIDSSGRTVRHRLAGKGIIATLSNPYWFVWWATTGLAFVIKSLKLGTAGPVVFYFGHIMSDFVWFTLVTILVWKGRKLMVGSGFKILILLCSAFLLWLGVSFIIDGINGYYL
ncbi:MAG: LysE family transporter [candidate division Zixibacteria bacterium]|nr:LysE family transporter [candidate division Zixibacteria bacterium]